jgi:sarcosine oxidase, subunit beta
LTEKADFLIVGGGVIGASIAYHLTSMGKFKVILCEQTLSAFNGSTKMSGGLIRMHHTNPYQAKLAWQSYQVYNHWPEIIGGDCGFKKTGFYLIVSKEYESNLRKNVKMLSNLGIPTTIVDFDNLNTFQPFCSNENFGLAAYEPYSGYANPIKTTLSFLSRAKQLGLKVYEGVKISELLINNDVVFGVKTNIGNIEAAEIILAGNIWIKHLLSKYNINIPIRSKRIGICFLELESNIVNNLSTYIDDTIGTYFRAVNDKTLLLGIATSRLDIDPDKVDLLERDEINKARLNLVKRIPQVKNAKYVGGRSSFDSYTPDKHAIIGRVDHIRGLYLATGFSGGGFKIAPSVGRAIAKNLLTSDVVNEITPYSLKRFKINEEIKPLYPYANM